MTRRMRESPRRPPPLALAVKLHGSDPGAAASPSGANGVKKLQDLELAAPNAGVKKLEDQDPAAPSADKNPQATNAQDKKTDEVKSEEDSPVRKEIVKNPRAAKGGAEGPEEALVRQKIGGCEKSEVSPVRQKIGGGEKPEVAPVPQKTGGKKSEEAPVPLGNQELLEQSGAFAKSAAGTSMADAADFFRRAAESFVGEKDRKKRVTETELSKAAIDLFYVTQSAPSSEAGLAKVAMKLTCDAQMVLLSDTGSKPGSWWRRAWTTSGPEAVNRLPLKQRLRAAISAPEPMLPIRAKHEKELVDKREVLYALALGAPVGILTSVAGLHIFPGAWAWVAGASVGIWILAASGMVVNQYAVLDWERLVARHLGRLGVLGAAVLFCFFSYRAFFPTVSWGFWILLAIAARALGEPWILSCIRGDGEFSSELGSAGDATGRV
ncbi:unnamed protein product [Urochloa decumbens]|uniref:Heme O synthase n=1 Tax=Urochloa decumbens TaxID=240449 RepID=A0ABC8ZDU1_9POAL